MSDQYAAVKAGVVALVEAAYQSNNDVFASLRAALGDVGSASPYNTVNIGTTERPIMTMAGSAWGPAQDRAHPENGPDPTQLDNTVFAMMVKGLVGQTGSFTTVVGNPTVNDDIDHGFNKGSTWINTLTSGLWILADNTSGAANWVGPYLPS